MRLEIAANKERELDRTHRPTAYEIQAYNYATKAYREHSRYGLPYAGGSKAQPVMWMIAMDCIHDAIRHADLEAQKWADLIASMK